MKKVLQLLPVLALLGYSSFAQTTPQPQDRPSGMAHTKQHEAAMEHDHMMMHDGKMMMMKSGAAAPMTETMTLPNGTKVMTDGTVMMKDGKKMMLKEGQEIGTDGKMHDDKKDHKMLHKGKM